MSETMSADRWNWSGKHPPLETNDINVAISNAVRHLDDVEVTISRVRPGKSVSVIINHLRSTRDWIDIVHQFENLNTEEYDKLDILEERFDSALCSVWITPSHEEDWWFVHHQAYG